MRGNKKNGFLRDKKIKFCSVTIATHKNFACNLTNKIAIFSNLVNTIRYLISKHEAQT